MKMGKVVVLVLLMLMTGIDCAKILGAFIAASHSHSLIGARLMKELAARGHEVTFITVYPPKPPVKNLRDIELTGFLEEINKVRENMDMFDMLKRPVFLMPFFVGLFGREFTDKSLAHENVQKLLHSNETFDLIIKEQFEDDALQGLGYHYKAPVMILSTVGPTLWTSRLIANPTNPSYIVDLFLDYPSKMTFCQRTYNTLMTVAQEIAHTYSIYSHNNIMHKYFPDAPHINDLIYNTSFVLLNSHESFDPPVPSVPNMVNIGGFHVEPPKKLPEDLQKFLDGAPEGVVYFSMGSNLKSKDLPAHKRDAILKVFSRLKLKVLWKWEDDKLPGQPANVKIQKWFPQQDILAHPNVKVFITHGGMLSTIEAIYHGVPLVGIPIFGDQKMNMGNAVRNGYAILVKYTELSEETLGNALDKIIGDPAYKENAKRRSQLLHDQPIKPIDRAVYWVEYVIKHKGAPHLRSAAINLPWYQYLLLDVILFIFFVSMTTVVLMCMCLKRIFCKGKSIEHKQKIN